MSCSGGCCCGGPDLRTPEEKRACEARRATIVMRVFIWGIVLAAFAVLATLLSGCAGNGKWNQTDQVERARSTAERQMLR